MYTRKHQGWLSTGSIDIVPNCKYPPSLIISLFTPVLLRTTPIRIIIACIKYFFRHSTLLQTAVPLKSLHCITLPTKNNGGNLHYPEQTREKWRVVLIGLLPADVSFIKKNIGKCYCMQFRKYFAFARRTTTVGLLEWYTPIVYGTYHGTAICMLGLFVCLFIHLY